MIRYIEEHQVFILETKSTQYAMCVRPDGHLEHLYYGGRSLDCGDQNIVGLWDVAHDRSLFETGNAIALDDTGYSGNHPSGTGNGTGKDSFHAVCAGK